MESVNYIGRHSTCKKLQSKMYMCVKGFRRKTRPLDKSAWLKNMFSYFTAKTYVVSAQRNRLNETVLLSSQHIFLNWWLRNYSQFYAQKSIYFNIC